MRYFKKLVGVSSSIVAVLAVGGIPGCGNVSGGDSEPTAADSETVAAAEVINSSGRAFVRADLFDSAERARILEEAADDTQPLTAEKLAAQLRGQMLANDTWYIEKEPPLELARKILAGDAIQSTPESTPQEGRRIIGADNRTHTTVAYNLAPSTYLGFSQIGCTANLIGTRSAVTAAHCVFETRDPLTEGFYCDNGTVGSTASTVGPNATVCGSNRVYARWRFGVEDTYGYTGWMGASGCAKITIPSSYISAVHNSSSIYDLSRWDYAAVDLSACSFSTLGHYGTSILTDQQILDATVRDDGYPARATCPNNTVGNATDCPASGAFRYSGSSAPFTGAEIWTASSSNVQKGSTNPTHTIEGDVDTSPGDSGSALYTGGSGVNRQLIGTLTGHTSTTNVWHRWNTETSNFIDANSLFPSDP
ncbi:MAG TPA: hypothetical protein VG937_06595 [Polyangiaceae bacterium]|nr:hypothetical protein [Polyangiaceae bacterium]